MLRALSVLLLLAPFAAAQAPGSLPNMSEISQALGVECGYCHTAARGSGQPEPKKDVARAMIAMTRDINARVEAATGKPAAEVARVRCATCHHGVAIPRPLSEILLRTLAAQGVAPAIAQYRDLRARYYGRQSYDFGEETLLDLGQRLASARPDDAMALLKLNLEFYPRSARSYAAIAYAATRKLDDATAMANLEKALEIEPENGVFRGQLEQLQSYHRKRP